MMVSESTTKGYSRESWRLACTGGAGLSLRLREGEPQPRDVTCSDQARARILLCAKWIASGCQARCPSASRILY